MNLLTKNFNEHFEVISADTEELLQQAYRIRYQVLCVEERVPDFEAEKFPREIETDDYDRRAVQSLLRYRPSGEYIGTVRLILSEPSCPEQSFPIEEFAGPHFDPALVQATRLPRAHTAEISRLVIKRAFRSRQEEAAYPYFSPTSVKRFPKDRRIVHHPFLGLLVAIMRMSARHGVTHWYAGMEPALHKRLARLGLKLTPLGPLVEYHGVRQPYIGEVGRLMDSIYFKHRDIWELLTEAGTIWPAPAPEAVDETGLRVAEATPVGTSSS